MLRDSIKELRKQLLRKNDFEEMINLGLELSGKQNSLSFIESMITSWPDDNDVCFLSTFFVILKRRLMI